MSSPRSCPHCLKPLPERTPSGVCPLCGSVIEPGAETPKTQDTPATREQDFTLGSDPDITASFDASTIPREQAVPPRPFVPPDIPNHTDLELLGRGGMGVVFRGKHRPTDRAVAIKVMLHFAADTESHARFLNEIRSQAKLKHAAVVPVYEAGECAVGPYFTMELVPGKTLAQLIRNGPVDPTEAARLVADAADGVHAAHQQGIIHRDIKPSNILLDGDGRVKVTDFGLARQVGADPATEVGMVVGTPSYMSPEQADADPVKVTKLADVYGLGGTLFHLATGRAPHHQGASPSAVRQRLTDPLPLPRQLRPELCQTLEAIILKSMAREPGDRYETAAALATDLRKWQAGEMTDALPLTRGQKARRFVRRNRVAVGLVLLLPFLAAGAAIARREMDPSKRLDRDLRAAAAGPPQAVELLTRDGRPRVPVWKLGESIIRESQLHDDTVGFQAQRLNWLSVADDPGANRFRFTAEVRQLTMRAEDLNRPNAPARVGIFWGLDQSEPQPAGQRHTVWAVEWDEFQPRTVGTKIIPLLRTEGHQPGQLPKSQTTSLAPPQVVPRAATAPPGLWRKFVVDADADGFTVTLTDEGPDLVVVRMGAESVSRAIAEHQKQLDKAYGAGTFVAPAWSPRRPLGICSLSGNVAFRNITLTPNP